jgi:kexin
VRLILAETARQNDPFNNADGVGWQLGASTPDGTSNYLFHHDYGFGVVDADAAVSRAKTWSNVNVELTPCTVSRSPNLDIPDPPDESTPATPVSDVVTVSGCGIGKIEFIEVTFTSNHTYAGDLSIALQSPSGVVSSLAETHICNDGTQAVPCVPYNGWVFGSAVHLGEAANGDWTLRVLDGFLLDTGKINSWSLKFYGRAS